MMIKLLIIFAGKIRARYRPFGRKKSHGNWPGSRWVAMRPAGTRHMPDRTPRRSKGQPAM